ncbi:zinc finger CCHC domain-containing 3-like [Paramuricea clavata]|uniref:Zinc finger CCHC domain-containing 3-like n=1 Tax=Paramuricea clavata TaxID=317549 RepID=A0A7D9E7S4_PARCT|nr:zinc finger CCHC domain-containing 3-like [Paramuricea clavata]
MEEVCHLGLTFRDVCLTFNPVRTAKWVNITRLSYGIPNEAIADALNPYGKVIQIKMDSFHGVYVGVRQVLMELSKPIPSRFTIAAHSCNCFYVGQVQTCFSCHQTGHMTKDCTNHARTTGNIINADGTGNSVRHTIDESHTHFPQLTDGRHPSITAVMPITIVWACMLMQGNQQLNNSVTHSDVPNAAVTGDKNVRNINKDSDNSEDEDEFVDVLEELPLPEGEGGEQPVSIVLGKRTSEPDDSDVSDISEKRVDRNPSSDESVVENDFVPSSLPLPPSPLARFSSPNSFSSLSDEVDPISMEHDANVDDSSPLPSAPPADDSVSIASEILGTPSIEAYEGGDEEDGGNDNMEPSLTKYNEYHNIPENGSEFSAAQENDTRTTPSTQIPPNLPRKENLDSESPSPIDPVTFAVPVTKRIGDPSF